MLRFTLKKKKRLSAAAVREQIVGEGAGSGGTREENGAGIQDWRVPWARTGGQMWDLFWTLSF